MLRRSPEFDTAMHCAGMEPELQFDRNSELLCAAASGVAAALLCTSQIEHVITAAHARGDGVAATARRVLRDRGAAGLLLPPGMAAMACREIRLSRSIVSVPHADPTLELFEPERMDRVV